MPDSSPISNTASVASLLGIDLAAARALGAYDPADEEAERRARPVGRPRVVNRRSADVDGLLAEFVQHAKDGTPDRMLAQRTGLSLAQVREWRRRHGIKKPLGRPSKNAMLDYAIRRFPRLGPDSAVLQTAQQSPVRGEWVPPTFARRPLNYDLFVSAMAALVERFTRDEIADALGVEVRDVENALALFDARGAA